MNLTPLSSRRFRAVAEAAYFSMDDVVFEAVIRQVTARSQSSFFQAQEEKCLLLERSACWRIFRRLCDRQGAGPCLSQVQEREPAGHHIPSVYCSGHVRNAIPKKAASGHKSLKGQMVGFISEIDRFIHVSVSEKENYLNRPDDRNLSKSANMGLKRHGRKCLSQCTGKTNCN